ncbi:ribonuclease HII [SAR116 cluster bacterium]|nr:ribonuclease HII [SAR116 cluster bacterium]
MDFDFDFQFDKQVIGVDEVGRGSWAGPVIAGAAWLNYKKPIDKRLKDSKKLTSKLRREILGNLAKNCIFGIGEVSNEKIDELGILGATFKAMHKAISCLIAQSKDLEESIILIDGTINPGFSKKIGSSIKLVKKGDNLSPSIAAASIFAKCARDDIMINHDEKFKGYGFSNNMGYGTKRHREKLYLSGPTQLHRMTFRPMKCLKN